MNPWVVIKVGGAFVESTEHQLPFFQQLISLQQQFNLLLVHGGGCLVDDTLQNLGFDSQKHQGLRITPAEQAPHVTGVLAGTVNKTLVSEAQQAGINAVGLSLLDGSFTECEQLDVDLGNVGKVTKVNTHLIEILAKSGYLPLISSIGMNAELASTSKLLNINADQAATALAQALDARLILLSDVPGVLLKNKLLPSLTPATMRQLINSGDIHGGMQVKVLAALEVARRLNRAVTIAGWQAPEQLKYLLDDQPFGTNILPFD